MCIRDSILTIRWIGQAPSGVDVFSESSNILLDFQADCTELPPNNSCIPEYHSTFLEKIIRFTTDPSCVGCGGSGEIIECTEDLEIIVECPPTITPCTNCDDI